MEPEITLVSVFILSLITFRISRKKYELQLAGTIAMSAMLIVTGIAHFFFTKGMALMLPEFVPFKMEIVYLTRVLELLFAIGLLLPKYQKRTAWLVILFFVLITPANVYATIKHINIETAANDGDGMAYLLYRIP